MRILFQGFMRKFQTKSGFHLPYFAKTDDCEKLFVYKGFGDGEVSELAIDKELADLIAGYFKGKYEKLRKEFEDL